jgi:hypothetical protein
MQQLVNPWLPFGKALPKVTVPEPVEKTIAKCAGALKERRGHIRSYAINEFGTKSRPRLTIRENGIIPDL